MKKGGTLAGEPTKELFQLLKLRREGETRVGAMRAPAKPAQG
jgi:hypothetical protein